MDRNKGNECFAEMVCCVCGRVFIPAVEHVFRVSGKWCCTYPCYIKLQAEIETRKAAERALKIVARKAKERERARRRTTPPPQAVPRPSQGADESAVVQKCETFVKTEDENGN